MRTALLLSGQIREFVDCSRNILDNIIRPTNADVYLYFTLSDKNKPDDVFRLLDIYAPKAYNYEENESKVYIPQLCLDRERYETKHSNNIFQMWRKIQLCFDSMEQTKSAPYKYDWIIKFRFDCKLENLIIDTNFLNQLLPDIFHIPVGGDWGGINDMMCIASHDNMKYYCDLYSYLLKYAEQSPYPFGYEELVKYHLRDKVVQRFPCDVMLRKNFDGIIEDRKFNL